MSELSLLREEWLSEQFKIANQVEILPDEIQLAERFTRLPLHSFMKDAAVTTTTTSAAADDDDENRELQSPYVGGVDVSFPDDEQNPAVAVYVILHIYRREIIYQDWEFFSLRVPYVPSFLAFREIDPLCRLVQKQLRERPAFRPAVILVDGNGILHPRGAGIACFLGVRTGIPTIGVGKTLFCEAGLTKKIVRNGLQRSLGDLAKLVESHPEYHSRTDRVMDNNEENEEEEEEHTIQTSNHESNPFVWWDRNPITACPGPAVSTGITPSRTVISRVSPNTTSMEDSGDQGKVQFDWGDLLNRITSSPRNNCYGVAIPLGEYQPADPHRRVLACALVAHGGGQGRRNGNHKTSAIPIRTPHKDSKGQVTKNPIFVSIGHQISLQRALQIVAWLSWTRIPEPIRQADLRGRALLRSRPSPKKFG